jgi:hypothetical protein
MQAESREKPAGPLVGGPDRSVEEHEGIAMSNEVDDLKSKVAGLLDRQRDSLDAELAALDELSKRAIAAALGTKKYKATLTSHVAWVASKRAEILSHLRQLEKHDRTMARTPGQQFVLIKAWLRIEATPAQRAEIAEMLAAVASQRGVLA